MTSTSSTALPTQPPAATAPFRAAWDDHLSAELDRRHVFCRHTISPPYRMLPHRHLGLEILYCRAGDGLFWFEDAVIPYGRGSALLFWSESAHGVQVTTPYDRWNLCFSPELFRQAYGLPGETLIRARLGQPRERVRSFRLPPDACARFEHLFLSVSELLASPPTNARLASELLPLRIFEMLILLERLGEGPAAQPERLRPAAGESGGIDAILAYIEAHLSDALSVEQLAREFGYSSSHLHRLIRRATGHSPAEWIRRRRMERAKTLLASGDEKLHVIAQHVGMESVSHFCRAFRTVVGVSPGAYRQHARAAR